jgi:acyl carrier protein
MNDDLAKEVTHLISRIIKIPEDKINLEANIFNDLGVDSLLGVEIFADLDKKYGLSLDEDKIKNINTLNDIIEMVKGQLAERRKA